MVPIPEGLDLDEWFVPPPPEPVLERAGSGEKKKKSKKGKEKQVNGGKKEKKGKKAVKDVSLDVPLVEILTPVYDDAETAEAIAERERVSGLLLLYSLFPRI
jgi:AP-3 complex subunit delta-1